MPPAPPVVRSTSRKPKARLRNSIAASPSSYRRYGTICCLMRRRLCGRDEAVLEKRFGRAAGEGAELADQVRLVVVPGLARDARPVRRLRALDERPCAVEAGDARERLRRHADLLAEARGQALAAPAERLREVTHACRAAGRDERPPRAVDLRRRRGATREDLVEHAEPRLPARRGREALGEERLVEYVLERDLRVGELVERHAEEPMRGRRDEVDVDAERAPLVPRRHLPVAQPARERLEALPVDRPRLAEAQDYDHVATRALAALQRLGRLLAEADV